MRLAILLIALMALPAAAQEVGQRDNRFNGIWVSTPYPALRVPADGTVPLKITVHNIGLPPQRVDLAVAKSPDGWTAELVGDGRAVAAVFAAPDQKTDLELRLTPPNGVKAGTYSFLVAAKTAERRFELPIELRLGAAAPPKLSLDPEFPALQGAPDSEFTFKIALRNDSGRDALVGLEAVAPPGFQASFTKEFGSQKLTSIPVKAGASEDIEAKVKPPQGTKAGAYPVRVRAVADKTEATAELTLDVTGQPELTLSRPDDRLSGRAEAGEETPLPLVINNLGTAPARDIQLASSEPSGWKIKFVPDKIAVLDAGQTQEVKAFVTPSAQAVAGDYMVTLRANGEAASDSSEFRITVETSTLWGIIGVAVIAAALVVMVLAMMRYGRR